VRIDCAYARRPGAFSRCHRLRVALIWPFAWYRLYVRSLQRLGGRLWTLDLETDVVDAA
jgi:hypothetical protein